MFLKKFVSRLLFLESGQLIEKARSKVLQEQDMLPLPQHLNPQTSSTLNHLPLDAQPWKFLLSLVKVYRQRLKWGYSFYLLALLASLLTPVLIHRFVSALQNSEDLSSTLAVGIALALTGVISGLSMQHYFMSTLATNQLITNDLNQLIFRQSLELSLGARTGAQVGDIVNHMSSDTEAISDVPIILGDFVWSTVTILVTTVLLVFYIGWSAVPALIVLMGLVPLTKIIARKFVTFEEKMMAQKDARITLMSQLLSSIRVIKFFAWERAVAKEVAVLREAELKSRQKLARAEVLSGVSYVAVSSLVLFVALLTHALRGLSLDAALVFTCISLFGLLEEPFGQLSRLFSRFSQGLVSSQRILSFLKTERVSCLSLPSPEQENLAIELRGASFSYGHLPIVKNLNLKVAKGSSLAIVGPVGAGKSTLLYGLLSECHLSQGSYNLCSSLERKAFVPQEAYIVNTTLLENIIFGEAGMHKENLRRALHQSCLDKDIKDLPAGLRTEIGEKGVNLSGGQKQRVSLARAAYSRPQLVFLDDPLSAVDVETEKQLCERLIFGEWKKEGVTRVVVTHRLESLIEFDQILFLKAGEVVGLGSLPQLLSENSEFREFYREHDKVQSSHVAVAAAEVSAGLEMKEESRITEDEEREKGAVKASVYWDYVLSLRGLNKKNSVLVALGLISILASTLPLLQKAWISNYERWTSGLSAIQAVSIYGVLGGLVLLSVMASQMLWLSRGLIAGRDFHDRMLNSILKSPVRFFDATPVGRILQRFSRDLESVDIYMQWSFESFIHCILHVLVSLVLVLTVMPFMIAVIIPTLWIYNRVQKDYRRPAREAKRLDSIARSPRYAHFKETLLGLVVIRAFQKRDWFLQDFFNKLTHSQRMFYGHYVLNRWFSSRVPIIAGVISVSTLIGISLAVKQAWVTPAMGGLVTIYALTFWGQLNWGIRIFADIESRMTSVERLKFYGQLPSEKMVGEIEPAASWPQKGELQVHNLQVRYAAHLPLVLKGLSFKIPAGQKIGIVGRTGSGKTTLFQALYRFIEADQGQILLDGVDISQVGLERLRKSLAIVPQDPSLFLGTLRSNLDRYQEYSDEEVWQAVKKAGLAEFVKGLTLQLQTPVAEGGANFSQGQRQLLCLARALLIQAKIVLMDEATASVDVQTDAQIQKIIRDQMKGVTILIIAHRLGTVADCDQVIEMADGRVKQIHDPSRENTGELKALLEEEPS